MTDRLNPATKTTVLQVTAAAYAIAQGDPIEAIDIALELTTLGAQLETVLAATVFRGRIESVTRVKVDKERAMPGKAKITYAREDGEPESIETDWLYLPAAMAIATRAAGAIGRLATFYKNNDDDPDGKRSQGFRRVVWLVVDDNGDSQ